MRRPNGLAAEKANMLGTDWMRAFFPAVQAFVTGGNPYAPLDRGGGFPNPPWLLPLLVPFGLLPPIWGHIGMGIVAITGLVALCVRLRRPWVALLVAGSIPMLSTIYWGNVEGFCLWGLAVGGPIGFFLLTVKPQVAGLVGLVWIWEAYQKERLLGVAKLVGPTAAIAVVSTFAYPQWIPAMLESQAQVNGGAVNAWPWLVPLGLLLLYQALKMKRGSWAGVSTAMITPYLRDHSLIAATTLDAADYPILGVIFLVSPWFYYLSK